MTRSGVLLVGHGTRDRSGTDQFFELARVLREICLPRELSVQPSLLEFQEPTIEQAWKMLIESGVRHIHVAPLLLFAAGHARQDIPEVITQCASKTPEITWDQALPLSRHRNVIELTLDRIQASCRAADVVQSKTALVMVGRGNRDCCAQADMRVLTEVISRKTEFRFHRTAFYAMAEPRLPAVLDEVASSRAEHVLVQPHLLFQGRLYDAIARQVDDANERQSGTKFILGNYLGPDKMIAEAVAERACISTPPR